MSQKFVDIAIAAEMMGHGWTVEKVIQKIQESELTAYARIHCCPQDDLSSDDHDDDNGKYEIARITCLKVKPDCQSEYTEWFFIHYEPVGSQTVQNELNGEYYHANQIPDHYHDQRIFGHLNNKSILSDIVSTEQICLLNTDIMRFMSGSNGIEKKPAQILAETRHNVAERDVLVDKIMKGISEKMKLAPNGCKFINHLRFIKEAEVPQSLIKSVAKHVRSKITVYFNGFYEPLSRAPKKKVTEDYFLHK